MEIYGISAANAIQPLNITAFPSFQPKISSMLQCASTIHLHWMILRPSKNVLLRNATLLAQSLNCDLVAMPLQ
jgi:hypothetical protein